MLPVLRKLFGGSARGEKPALPAVQKEPASQQKQENGFEAHVKALWAQVDFCAAKLKERGMVPLEDSFISELALGMIPNPAEPFIGQFGGKFLKLPDAPPRVIAFIGAISSQGGAYFTAGFFSDDGEMMNVIGFVPLGTLYEYLQRAQGDFAKDLRGEHGALGHPSKWLDAADKTVPPAQLPAPRRQP